MRRTEFVLSFVFFCAVVQEVRLAVDERLKDDFFRIHKNVAGQTRDILSSSVASEEVTFYLHTSQITRKFTAGDKDYFDGFRNFDNPIVFIIHGWMSSQESDWMHNMTDAFLIRDPNSMVILVDWKGPANHIFYPLSYIKTHAVSKIISDVLINIYENYEVDKKNFLLVGHSLGGQICGFIGKQFQKETLGKLPRLVALDPAGPLFQTFSSIDERLNRDDAEVVEVIHTNGEAFGYWDACGTIDFFVNGGWNQPGCHRFHLEWPHLLGSIKNHLLCSHRRSWAYFIEAVRNPTDFISQKCRSGFLFNRCDDEFVSMGDLNTTKTGHFYLETNEEAPYSKKIKGGF